MRQVIKVGDIPNLIHVRVMVAWICIYQPCFHEDQVRQVE